MSKLAAIRSQLAALRFRRALLRRGQAVSLLVFWIVLTLGVLFFLDWFFELPRWQRLIPILAGLGLLAYGIKKYILPRFAENETELDLALLVESQQGFDADSRDLVAALQFDSVGAQNWGSAQLQQAVVAYVSDAQESWDVFSGFTWEPLFKRLGWVSAVTAVALVCALVFPGHASAFFARLLLSSQHYPTRTQIEEVLVNGKPIDPTTAEGLRSPYGQPIEFEVRLGGEIPQQGTVSLQSLDHSVEHSIDLNPKGISGQRFGGTLDRLTSSVQFQLYCGDAWTDPATIELVPLPTVDIQFRATPPAYAQTEAQPEEIPSGARNISVIEGSSLQVNLTSNKPLKSVRLNLQQEETTEAVELVAADSERLQWQLPSEETPLENILKRISYEVSATDEDDLQLEFPLKGEIRIKSDRPPQVSADLLARTELILPEAKPVIQYRARDDYGIAALRIRREVQRSSGEMEEQTVTFFAAEQLPADSQALRGRLASQGVTKHLPETPPLRVLEGTYRMELSSLGLQKGDQLRVSIEATDFRGKNPGQTSVSEVLLLQVTDEQGIFAAMFEQDKESARHLDAIIRRQLGIGESP